MDPVAGALCPVCGISVTSTTRKPGKSTWWLEINEAVLLLISGARLLVASCSGNRVGVSEDVLNIARNWSTSDCSCLMAVTVLLPDASSVRRTGCTLLVLEKTGGDPATDAVGGPE